MIITGLVRRQTPSDLAVTEVTATATATAAAPAAMTIYWSLRGCHRNRQRW